MTTLTPVTITPPGRPSFAFTLSLPPGWQPADLPDVELKFDDPKFLLPLAVLAHGPTYSVLAVAARPAYEDGTVLQWFRYLSGEQSWQVESMYPTDLGPHRAVGATFLQKQDDGSHTRGRAALFEDGQRMFAVTLFCPVENFDAMGPLFDHVLASFHLAEPQGRTVPLDPEEEQAGIGNAPAAAAAPQINRPDVPAEDLKPSEKTLKDFALAADAATLDPEHPVAKNLREQGVGLTPNLVDVDEDAGHATVAAGAIAAFLKVPLGWHVLDDGQRTLVFDPENRIQVNFNRFVLDGETEDDVFKSIVADLSESNPDARYDRIDLGPLPEVGPVPALAATHLVVDGASLAQLYLLTPVPGHPTHRLKTRLTVTPEDIVRGGDLAEILVRNLTFPG